MQRFYHFNELHFQSIYISNYIPNSYTLDDDDEEIVCVCEQQACYVITQQQPRKLEIYLFKLHENSLLSPQKQDEDRGIDPANVLFTLQMYKTMNKTKN